MGFNSAFKGLIYYSKSALHVSGDVFAHHQEHVTVFTVTGSVHHWCCRLVSRMSWNAVLTHPRHLSANWYDVYYCCVYSEKLLMIDRGTARNM